MKETVLFPNPALWRALTSREREVLVAVVEGATDRETAARLRLSVKTVACHMASLFHKTAVAQGDDKVRTRTRLVATVFGFYRATTGLLADVPVGGAERALQAGGVRYELLLDFLRPFYCGAQQPWKKGFSHEALAYVAAQVDSLEWVTQADVRSMANLLGKEKEQAEHELV